MTDKQAISKQVKFRAEGSEAVSGLIAASIGLNEKDLTKYLTDHQVKINDYGQNGARTFKELSTELIKGESSLQEDSLGS